MDATTAIGSEWLEELASKDQEAVSLLFVCVLKKGNRSGLKKQRRYDRFVVTTDR